MGCHYEIKFVVVVDEDIDIDIDNSNQVEWAIATRFQAERDLVVVQGALGSKLDPSTKKHTLSSKVGFDATKYLDEIDKFYVTRVPSPADYVFTEPDRATIKKYHDYIA